jgi:hypothetical protein
MSEFNYKVIWKLMPGTDENPLGGRVFTLEAIGSKGEIVGRVTGEITYEIAEQFACQYGSDQDLIDAAESGARNALDALLKMQP